MPTRTLFTRGFATFVADPQSMDHLGSGQVINWAAFGTTTYGAAGQRVIPAGTAVEVNATTGGLDPHGSGRILLLVTDAVEASRTAALSGYGAYTGGNVYTELLPTATQAKAATLAPHFHLQKYIDVRGGN